MAVAGTYQQGGAYRNYQRTQVETASPTQLLLLVYDGAIRKLGDAAAATLAENIPQAHDHLTRVQDILVELMLALDHQVGGEVSQNLYRLYEYMYTRLVEANVRRSIEPIEEVRELLADLRAGWQEAINQLEGTGTAEPVAAMAGASAATPPAPPVRENVAMPGVSLNLSG